MRILDATLGYNELDIFEIRAMTLLGSTYPINDIEFLIIESPTTFSGIRKPLYFTDRLNTTVSKYFYNPYTKKVEFGDPWDIFKAFIRIKVIELYGNTAWDREHYSRNEMWNHVYDRSSDFDYVLFGDMDEIPNPLAIQQTWTKRQDLPLVIYNHDLFYYTPQFHFGEIGGTRGFVVGYIQENWNNSLWGQKIRESTYPIISPNGWHFSYFGGTNTISNKLKAYAHTELNTIEIQNSLQEKIKTGEDIANRKEMKATIKNPLEYIPQYLRDNYSYFIHNWSV